MGTGVAGASAGFPAVQAGGPPVESKPVRHVYKPKYVPREKPVLHNPRWRPPKVDVIVDNHNHSRNENKHRHHKHHENVKHEDVKHDDVKHDDVKYEPVKDKYDDYGYESGDHDRNNWWWPGDSD
ncbi:hypothetical protein [Nonomuraea candida]|uniref:hypothetical protein n=1 Tax=Nonomuraea candida TaxID=359159 RepID=UPI0012FCFB2F|nr:hypothetical protein [Nonomuraea candida]